MSGPVVHVSAGILCPHGGSGNIIPSGPRVTVGGQPVATMADSFMIAGCAFMMGNTPHPCMRIQWLVPAARVQSMGQPVITQASTGLALAADQMPQGPPVIGAVQPRVMAQ
jgi:hypothetical protein